MPRISDEPIVHWKLSMPATLAGRTEALLMDDITGKPRYGARNRLVVALLERYLCEQAGLPQERLPHVPSIEELRV